MKNFSRAVSLILLMLLLTGLIGGCAQKEEQEPDGLSIVTTIFPTYDFARNILGEDANISLLLKPGEESHSYEPTPQDILKIRNCDLFIYVGGESDTWVESVLSSSENPDRIVLTLMDCITPLEEEHIGEEKHSHDDGNAGYDEHIWTSPQNAIRMVKKISSAVITADPENASAYEKNTAAYILELEELDREFRTITENAERKTLIVADRFPFLYFVKEYGLDYHAAFSGCSEESEVSAATIATLVGIVKEEKIPVVFQIELSSGRIADSVCAETGTEKLTLHSCNNLTKDEYNSGETYLSIMKRNAEVLRKALGEKDGENG